MAEDWAKLIADAKKLEGKIKNLTLEDGKGLWKDLQTRDKLMEAHEKALQKAAIAAHEAGIGSKKLAEFQKDKGFAAAYKLLDADRSQLVSELKLLEAHCDKCKAAAHLVEDHISLMDKLLVGSKNKEKSAERTAAKKVRDALYERFNELGSANNLRYLPDKYMTSFDGQFDKLIDHLIAEAFKKAKDKEVPAEVPQPLADKKLGLALKEAQKLDKVIKTCLEKKGPLATTDGAYKLLTAKAWDAKDELQKLADHWKALGKKFKKELEAADGGAKASETIEAIEALFMAATKAMKDDNANDAAKEAKEIKFAKMPQKKDGEAG